VFGYGSGLIFYRHRCSHHRDIVIIIIIIIIIINSSHFCTKWTNLMSVLPPLNRLILCKTRLMCNYDSYYGTFMKILSIGI
jgi:hypothetical protein